MKNRSYWDTVFYPGEYDLAVVGAGIVGLSAALHFMESRPGASVVVLERGGYPWGASTRNAGFACIGSISEHLADLERIPGEQVRRRILRRYDGLRLLRERLGDDNIDYIRCGGDELFTSNKTFTHAEKQIGRFNRWLRDLTGEENVYESGVVNGYPAIHNRLEGSLHPGKLIRTLVRQAHRSGVELRWDTTVSAVDPEIEVTGSPERTINARQVLVATNGFTRELLPQVEVKPARGYIFVTKPIAGLEWRGTFFYNEGYVYFRNVGDRMLLGGARNVDMHQEETTEEGVNELVKDHLTRFADEVLQLPDSWQIEQEWAGIMGFTESKTPLIQRLNDRISVAAGLSGMGVAIGMEVGMQAAELISAKHE